ncbi:MAG: XRE family transcriptional regulator [Gaiellaceae bacterium]
MNERLRRALHEGGIDLDDVARATGVNHRTVQRWLAGRVPYPRYRGLIARLVRRDEGYLWPGVVSRDPAASASAELIDAYAHRTDVPADVWWELLCGATRHVDFVAYALLHLPENHPRLVDLLRGKAAAGCAIRIAVADPDCSNVADRDEEEGLGGTLGARIRTSLRYLDPLGDCPGVELRFHAVPMYNSVFRFDDDMLVTPHVYGRPGRLSPLLHLRRRQEDGIFDNYLTHLEDVWASAVPIPAPASVR